MFGRNGESDQNSQVFHQQIVLMHALRFEVTFASADGFDEHIEIWCDFCISDLGHNRLR